MSSIALISVLAVLAASPAQAATCYNRYGNPYYCTGGLGYGARIGIGIAVAAGVLILFAIIGYMRRRSLKNQFSKYRPPALPFTNGGQQTDPNNPYANNPPPPQAGSYYANQGSNTNWNSNNYGNNPPPPQQAYQPSMAGQYGGVNKATNDGGAEDHEHGYEWQQAREQERLEREQAGAAAPPGYEVANSAQNTGTSHTYAPPPGPPPTSGKRTTEGTV